MSRPRLTWSKKKLTTASVETPKGSVLKLNGVEVARTQQLPSGTWFWFGGYGKHRCNSASNPKMMEVEVKAQAQKYVLTAFEAEAAACCAAETRTMAGGCTNCGDPAL